MARYSRQVINGHLQICDNGTNNHQKGKAFEDLAAYLFETIAGISLSTRNQMNVFNSEEIDIAVWNDKSRFGLHFLPDIILIECKNWSLPVSSIEISWFCQKVLSRGLDFGILIANNGITGDPSDLTAAHSIIAQHLIQKRRIIVITRQEILLLRTTAEMVALIKKKICLLTVAGRIVES
jgi:restriction endonuclease